jgi:hypothetical protein
MSPERAHMVFFSLAARSHGSSALGVRDWPNATSDIPGGPFAGTQHSDLSYLGWAGLPEESRTRLRTRLLARGLPPTQTVVDAGSLLVDAVAARITKCRPHSQRSISFSALLTSGRVGAGLGYVGGRVLSAVMAERFGKRLGAPASSARVMLERCFSTKAGQKRSLNTSFDLANRIGLSLSASVTSNVEINCPTLIVAGSNEARMMATCAAIAQPRR